MARPTHIMTLRPRKEKSSSDGGSRARARVEKSRNTVPRSIEQLCNSLPLELFDQIRALAGDIIVDEHMEHIRRSIQHDGLEKGYNIRLRQDPSGFLVNRAILDHNQSWPSGFPVMRGKVMAASLARRFNWVLDRGNGTEFDWLIKFLNRWACMPQLYQITIVQPDHHFWPLYGRENCVLQRLEQCHGLGVITLGIGYWSPM